MHVCVCVCVCGEGGGGRVKSLYNQTFESQSESGCAYQAKDLLSLFRSEFHDSLHGGTTELCVGDRTRTK